MTKQELEISDVPVMPVRRPELIDIDAGLDLPDPNSKVDSDSLQDWQSIWT